MDTVTWDTNLLVHIVKKILRHFEEWNSKTSLGKVKYNYIDVTLVKDDSTYYTVQLTNYGQSANDISSFSREIFWNIVTADIVFKNSLIATVCSRNERSNCQETLDLYFTRNRLSLMRSENDASLINFFYQKTYLSFLLKNRLISTDKGKFLDVILNEIVSLQRINFYIKFTVHINRNVLYNNYIPLDYDYKLCQVLAIALTNVVKQSLSVKFKENCFSMLNVENSHEVETALMIKLIPLIHENYTFPSVN